MGPQQARRSLAAARRAGQAGRRLIGLTLLASIVVAVLIFWGLLLFTVAALANGASEQCVPPTLHCSSSGREILLANQLTQMI